MTDYFALLDQPRRPWLDPEELKRIFHEKALQAHPDAQRKPSGNEAFTELSEAYQVLRDPKRRLQHLLTLAGSPPSAKSVAVPAEIDALFPSVAALIQQTDDVIRRTSSSNALSRSLVRPQLLKITEGIREMQKRLMHLQGESLAALKTLSSAWLPDDLDHQLQLHGLYLQFSYLTRWIAELEEKETQLAIQR